MAPKIIDLDGWLENTAAGQYARAWQQAQFDAVVADLFGFQALQIGALSLQGLQENRIQHRWRAATVEAVAPCEGAASAHTYDFITAPEALPFADHQLDLIVMPHTLESCHQPHAALREAARVLRPEGKLIITGFNPARFWGVRPKAQQMPWGKAIGYWRLRDWLQLLELDIHASRSGCYLPALRSAQWLHRLAWIDRLSDRHLSFLAGIYFIVATKHIQGARLLEPEWRSAKLNLKPLPLASAPSRTQSKTQRQSPPQHPHNDS